MNHAARCPLAVRVVFDPRALLLLCALLLGPFVGSGLAWAEDAAEPVTVGEAAAMVEPEAAPPAPRGGSNCLGEAKTKVILSNLIGIKYGDWGVEHQLRLGVCTPLVRKPGVLFDFSFIEAGFVMHTTPIYVMPGAYLIVAPLSILQFQIEGAPIAYWPIGIAAAGYYPLPSITADYSKESLLAEDGGSARGGYVRFGPNLQLAVPMGPARLLVLDQLRFEYATVGTADFYFHNRNDLPAARSQWFLDNMAMVLVELPLSANVKLLVGVNDQITRTIGAPVVSNAVRGAAILRVDDPKLAAREISVVLALGGRTHHPIRQGDFNAILAFSVKLDLTHRRPQPEPEVPLPATEEPAPPGEEPPPPAAPEPREEPAPPAAEPVPPAEEPAPPPEEPAPTP